MMLLKACPRCGGDLIVEREEFAQVVTCLQCGYTGDLRTLRRIQAERAFAAPLPGGREREEARVT